MTTSKSKIVRELKITDGREIREIYITRDAKGFWLHEAADVNDETRDFLADDSDANIMDVLSLGWEIVSDD